MMDSIKDWFSNAADRVKEIFKKKKTEYEPPQIVIGQITQHPAPPLPIQASGSTQDGNIPTITIGQIHQRPSVEANRPIEGDVVQGNRELGNGIHINRQSKPKICPICRTNGSVVSNTSGNSTWRCTESDCGAEF
ncbi:MAG: hypothetical protein LBM93_02945 [Oscillospiraceae bacterium]|jgi:hypothetical protein|nr:hypothetical protein [Oscillospiraceae bacterium]